MNKILVCGGRDFSDKEKLFLTLDKICFERNWKTETSEEGNWLPVCTVISGKAKGADTLAIDWAIINWCNFLEYPADWEKHGKKAGFLRNIQMLHEGKPDLVVAFPGGRGTAHMVKIAKENKVEVIEVS